jgi:hypothetical protein
MSISKYFGTPSDSSGKPLFWSPQDDYPFRGTPPSLLKKEEMDQIPIVYDAKAAVLQLPDEIEKYQDVIDRCANGLYILRHEKFEYDQTSKKYTVFLSWLEVYGQTPTSQSAWEAIKNANRG